MLEFELQLATLQAGIPSSVRFQKWVEAALQGRQTVSLVIRVVDEHESGQLNSQFRGIQGATNVLSFPADIELPEASAILGDIAICAPVVADEAEQQGKNEEAHWAHLTIHGVLHLRGYDHQNESEASEMEALEVQLLRELGYADPYKIVKR